MGKPPDDIAKRGEVLGWTPATARRLTKWLQSVDATKLNGLVGFTLSLTARDIPEAAEDWGKARLLFIKRLRRMGAMSWHWLTEWQARGAPHMHGMVFFPPLVPDDHPEFETAADDMRRQLLEAWLAVSARWGSTWRGQNIKEINAIDGWLRYLGKHGARGVRHYQRAAENIPEGWKGSSVGRLWGYGGEWGIVKPLKFDLSADEYVRFGRLLQGYLAAQAAGRLRHARLSETQAEAQRLRFIQMLRGGGLPRTMWRKVGKWAREALRRRNNAAAAMVAARRSIRFVRRMRHSRHYTTGKGERRALTYMPFSAWIPREDALHLVEHVAGQTAEQTAYALRMIAYTEEDGGTHDARDWRQAARAQEVKERLQDEEAAARALAQKARAARLAMLERYTHSDEPGDTLAHYH